MSKPIKLYLDLMSQPCRALYILFELAKIPHEKVSIRIGKGEHLTPEFTKINRFQKLPVIEDNGFKLAESTAILQYLDRSGQYPEVKKFYPDDLKTKALIDEYMSWQHLNTRAHCAMYFQYVWLFPLLKGKAPEEKKTAEFRKRMEKVLDDFENIWLKEGNKFLVGDKLTAADIWAACELEQPRAAGYNPFSAERPKLSRWWNDVKGELNPVYEESHQMINKIVNRQQAKTKL